jgi:PASTA domain-containing protein
VEPGSAVYLEFTSPPLVTVPDLRKLSPSDAGTVLAGLGLKLGSVRGIGRVIRQYPPAGSQVAPHSAVDIELSLSSTVIEPPPPPARSASSTPSATVGSPTQPPPTTASAPTSAAGSEPPPALVRVPYLRGLNLGEARAAAQAADLSLDAGGASTGTVVTQSPSDGSEVARGSAVTVTVTVSSAAAAATGRQASPDRSTWNPANWNIVALALIALAILLICGAGFVVRTKRPPRGRRARGKPWPPDGVEVSCRLAESRLQTTATGSAPRRVRIDVHGPIANIETKEVPR